MRGTARNFGLFLERTVGHVGYILGTRGELCSPSLRAQQAKIYTAQASKILAASRWDGIPVVDCMGWCEMFENGGDVFKPLSIFKYPNRTTYTDYEFVDQRNIPHGPISTLPKDMPDEPLAVGYQGHVGYFYKGKVYQSAGHVVGTVITELGVVLSGLKPWQYWYKMPYLEYATEDIIMKNGDRGPSVLEFQVSLVEAGYPIRDPDGTLREPNGIFGPNTERAVNNFKSAVGLPMDGVVDEGTWAKMTEVLRNLRKMVSESLADTEDKLVVAENYASGVELKLAETAGLLSESQKTLQEQATRTIELSEEIKINKRRINNLVGWGKS